MTRSGLAVVLLAGAAVSPLAGQARPAGWLQADAFYQNVTNDYGDWKGFGLRSRVPVGSSDILFAEAVLQEAFRDEGLWLSFSDRHEWGGDWFTLAGIGGGTGEFHLPDLRLDGTVGRSWLQRRNLVTLLSGTYVNAKQGYSDALLSGSVAAFFPGFAFEGGFRINWSSPGDVRTERGFGAVTYGRDRDRVIVLRGSGGYEGYQLTGTDEVLQKFRSYEGSLSWREWLGGNMGFVVQLDWYDNPSYTRSGALIGVFRHW